MTVADKFMLAFAFILFGFVWGRVLLRRETLSADYWKGRAAYWEGQYEIEKAMHQEAVGIYRDYRKPADEWRELSAESLALNKELLDDGEDVAGNDLVN